jgi:hypothetical protein
MWQRSQSQNIHTTITTITVVDHHIRIGQGEPRPLEYSLPGQRMKRLRQQKILMMALQNNQTKDVKV